MSDEKEPLFYIIVNHADNPDADERFVVDYDGLMSRYPFVSQLFPIDRNPEYFRIEWTCDTVQTIISLEY